MQKQTHLVESLHDKKWHSFMYKGERVTELHDGYLGCPIFQHGSLVFSTGGEYCWSASPGHEHNTALRFLY